MRNSRNFTFNIIIKMDEEMEIMSPSDFAIEEKFFDVRKRKFCSVPVSDLPCDLLFYFKFYFELGG